MAFSVNQLLEKIEENTEYRLCPICTIKFSKEYNGTYEYQNTSTPNIQCENCENLATTDILLTKLIFFLDEQTKTLKTGGLIRLANIVDTCRQRQICFITCGVDQYGMNFTTYNLRRIQESGDEYLPKKRVRFGVYDDSRSIWYGYLNWDVVPLTDPSWMEFWKEYSTMKTEFQRVAISQQIQSIDFEDMGQEIINSPEFQKCLGYNKQGRMFIKSGLVKTLIVKRHPDLTGEERGHILSEVKLILDETEI